jgi:hypothetical protein
MLFTFQKIRMQKYRLVCGFPTFCHKIQVALAPYGSQKHKLRHFRRRVHLQRVLEKLQFIFFIKNKKQGALW